MSSEAFQGAFARSRPRAVERSHAEQRATTRHLHPASEWIGELGEHVRLQVRVTAVENTARGLRIHYANTEGAPDAVTWTSGRRHGIRVGERLALSGVVKAHVEQDGARVTVLRDCFNPMRMA